MMLTMEEKATFLEPAKFNSLADRTCNMSPLLDLME